MRGISGNGITAAKHFAFIVSCGHGQHHLPMIDDHAGVSARQAACENLVFHDEDRRTKNIVFVPRPGLRLLGASTNAC